MFPYTIACKKTVNLDQQEKYKNIYFMLKEIHNSVLHTPCQQSRSKLIFRNTCSQ